MNKFIKIIKNIDSKFCKHYLSVSKEKPSLIVFTFHKIFKCKSDIYLSGVDPQQGTTLEEFKLFIEYFLSAGYIFIHPDKIHSNIDLSKKYILITFDDGYFNNSYVLSIIQEYKAPCIFFISTNNVLFNEPFWWDILYRQKGKGINQSKIDFYKGKLKKFNPPQIRDFIKLNFPKVELRPKNDFDRPFTVNELKDFSQQPFVVLGNHTADHSILTNCSIVEMKNQIETSQLFLRNITGTSPDFIAYPNGNFSNEVINVVKEFNFKLGFTIIRGKNFLPFKFRSDFLKIKRFIMSNLINIQKDGYIFRSNYSLYNSGVNIYSKFKSLKVNS